MPLVHHDAREYNEAKSEAVLHFKEIVNKEIQESRGTALAVIERVQNEVPLDRIINTHGVQFDVEDDDDGESLRHVVVLKSKNPRGALAFDETLHPHALRQAAQIAGMPIGYINDLLAKDKWGQDLLIENLNTLIGNNPPRKLLTRSVNSEVKGVLSDAYRRMDSRPILEAFAKACSDVGAVPVQGQASDLRFSVKALLPMVFEPKGEEVIAFGLRLANSDFGMGALSLSAFVDRLWCTNHAVLSSELRQVHLGKRLSDEIEFSEETYKKDTEVMALALRDMVHGLLSPGKVNETVKAIEQAIETKVDVKIVLDGLRKSNKLLVREVDEVREIYNNGGVEQLPRGDSLYRMSNAISWFSKSQTVERRMVLEELAGEVLQKGLA